jgi:hypothetical protein
MHSGQKHWIGNAEVEIIFTHEDLYTGGYYGDNETGLYSTIPEEPTYNVSDNVFRITVNNQSAMILGDSEGQYNVYTSGADIGKPQDGKTWWANDWMAKWYGGYLKSDILQAAHHGGNEGLLLYQAIDPTIVLCPSSGSHNKTLLANKWIYDGVNYLGKTTQVTKENFHYANKNTLLVLEKCPGKIELPMMPMQ